MTPRPLWGAGHVAPATPAMEMRKMGMDGAMPEVPRGADDVLETANEQAGDVEDLMSAKDEMESYERRRVVLVWR